LRRIAESVRKVNSIPRLHWLAQIVQFGVSGVFLVKAGHGHQNGAAWGDAGASHAATGSSVPINGATGDTSVTPARGGRCPVLIWLMAGVPDNGNPRRSNKAGGAPHPPGQGERLRSWCRFRGRRLCGPPLAAPAVDLDQVDDPEDLPVAAASCAESLVLGH
jgi:hypothetical protein